jgi:hypothetical protein
MTFHLSNGEVVPAREVREGVTKRGKAVKAMEWTKAIKAAGPRELSPWPYLS